MEEQTDKSYLLQLCKQILQNGLGSIPVEEQKRFLDTAALVGFDNVTENDIADICHKIVSLSSDDRSARVTLVNDAGQTLPLSLGASRLIILSQAASHFSTDAADIEFNVGPVSDKSLLALQQWFEAAYVTEFQNRFPGTNRRRDNIRANMPEIGASRYKTMTVDRLIDVSKQLGVELSHTEAIYYHQLAQLSDTKLADKWSIYEWTKQQWGRSDISDLITLMEFANYITDHKLEHSLFERFDNLVVGQSFLTWIHDPTIDLDIYLRILHILPWSTLLDFFEYTYFLEVYKSLPPHLQQLRSTVHVGYECNKISFNRESIFSPLPVRSCQGGFDTKCQRYADTFQLATIRRGRELHTYLQYMPPDFINVIAQCPEVMSFFTAP